jgi:hypothetical protein
MHQPSNSQEATTRDHRTRHEEPDRVHYLLSGMCTHTLPPCVYNRWRSYQLDTMWLPSDPPEQTRLQPVRCHHMLPILLGLVHFCSPWGARDLGASHPYRYMIACAQSPQTSCHNATWEPPALMLVCVATHTADHCGSRDGSGSSYNTCAHARSHTVWARRRTGLPPPDRQVGHSPHV